jgi:predicted methyltransferase
MTFKQSLAIAAATVALAAPAWAHDHGTTADAAEKEAADAVTAATSDAETAVNDAMEAVDEMTTSDNVVADSETPETVDEADVDTEVTETASEVDVDTTTIETTVAEDVTEAVETVSDQVEAVTAPVTLESADLETPTVDDVSMDATTQESETIVETVTEAVTDAADAVVPPTPSAEIVAPAAAAVTERVEASMPETTSVVTDLTNMRTVLAAGIRDEDRARDEFRNPLETLSFFGIKPDMAVGEYAPGGGWYTRILAPYLSAEGRYVAINHDIDAYLVNADEERFTRAKAWADNFPMQLNEWTGLPADNVMAFEVDEVPEGMEASLDAVVIFRSLHGLYNREMADSTIRDFYTVLKPGGIVGVVQHRAPDDAPHAYVDGSNGYLKQSEVIALFKSQGFKAVKQSDINANPDDPANWDGGVWTLPPVLRYGDDNRDEYTAIGESDRMTLVFRKPE